MIEPTEVQMVAIEAITILNPRARNKKVFGELVKSIAHLGLKKPITVGQRSDGGYDLVCGQRRLEAFIELGQEQIPAFVIEAAEDDCYLMSLVENLARRQHSPLELIREIGALRERGYNTSEIATKIDFSTEYVYAICTLLEKGEKRLLSAIERGMVPHTIAMEIARSDDAEVQNALAEAYENKSLPGNQVLAIRRIIEDRKRLGKDGIHSGVHRNRRTVTAESLVRAYRKETDRQKLMIKKATLAQSRLLFIINALRHLLSDEHFVTLLRAESMSTIPQRLVDRLG